MKTELCASHPRAKRAQQQSPGLGVWGQGSRYRCSLGTPLPESSPLRFGPLITEVCVWVFHGSPHHTGKWVLGRSDDIQTRVLRPGCSPTPRGGHQLTTASKVTASKVMTQTNRCLLQTRTPSHASLSPSLPPQWLPSWGGLPSPFLRDTKKPTLFPTEKKLGSVNCSLPSGL